MKLHTTLIDLAALSLCAACGGRDEGNATPPEDTGTGSTGGQTGTGAVTRLPFPFAAWMCDPVYAHIPGACGDDGYITDHHSGFQTCRR